MVTLHPDEVVVDPARVRSQVRARFPQWAELPVTRVASHGTVNRLFRLGDDLVVRVPRVADDVPPQAEYVASELARPRLERLGVQVPRLVAVAPPSAEVPVTWSVTTWIDGVSADRLTPGSPDATYVASPQFVRDLAAALTVLRGLPTHGKTWPGWGRGGTLAACTPWVRDYLRRCEGLRGADGGPLVDVRAVTAAWERAAHARPAPHESWTHNDVMPGNLLIRDGRLAALIDWGQACVADPAVDLQWGWNLLTAAQRLHLRDAMTVGDDPHAWLRGRGWAIAQAIGCVWYYQRSNPSMSQLAARTLAEVTRYGR